ncbi:MAG TPA: helix-hairpin-helix domain-containing protein [Planctomycetota bacterium]|nr:helix-hairpin-helix domain-containing protein [Planctomycetota bacterium]
MRRADRLFQIVQLLRRSRATTAAQLGTELGVSERTIYRDVQDLLLSGIPVQGEAGVGYALPPHFELPPLMFDGPEIEALALGARMVQGWSDESLARAARSALRKIENVLPQALAERVEQSRLFVPDFHVPKDQMAALQQAREALDAHRVLRLGYRDEHGRRSRRHVRPLGLFYWGRTWTLLGWCELRVDFRSFRLDRIVASTMLARTFVDEPGKRLEDFLARMTHERAQSAQSPAPRPTRSRRAAGPVDPGEHAAWRTFQQLGSIGPACAHDLLQLGFRRIEDLCGQDPNELYARLCELTHQRQDPCVEDTLRCAIAQAEHAQLPAAWRQWHRWTPLRGKPAGTLPAELAGMSKRRP